MPRSVERALPSWYSPPEGIFFLGIEADRSLTRVAFDAVIAEKPAGRFMLPAHRNLRAVQFLLGHTKIEITVRYLGIERVILT